MALVRGFQNDEYQPEYGTLVLREPWVSPPAAGPAAPDRLTEHGTALRVSGTFVAAGAGWLYGSARDGYHRVTLELHDGDPGDDRPTGWDEDALILRMRQPSRQLSSPLSRVDVHSGRIEQVPTARGRGHGAVIVTPLLRPGHPGA